MKLELNDLTFSWEGTSGDVFSSISFEFVAGKTYSLLGENGSGKTTFLNVLGCRLHPTSGDLLLSSQPPRVGDFNYMLQLPERQLFPHLDILENIFLRNSQGMSYPSYASDLLQTLFPSSETLRASPVHVSGGQRQRALLARALMDMPFFPVTLLDEPFSRLSQAIKPSIYSHMKSAVGLRPSIAIVVTHDIAEAMIVADEAIILTRNGIVSFDTHAVGTHSDFIEAGELRSQLERTLYLGTSHPPEG